MIGKIHHQLKTRGLSGLLGAVYQQVRGSRIMAGRVTCWPGISAEIKDCTGLEIGGPSGLFKRSGRIPVYALARRIDNCNFDRLTIWEGSITEGKSFKFDKRQEPGRQYIAEAAHLSAIPSEHYDVVLSSHVLEHCANALQALSEWIRVLKEQGLLVLVLPHKDGTFDHARPVTTMAHLIQDFDQGTDERDLTHLEEILRLHDLSKDPGSGGSEAFRERSHRNFENRCLHHHVFDTNLAIQVVNHMKMKILAVEAFAPYNILVVARKSGGNEMTANDRFFVNTGGTMWKSPFPSDHETPRQ
jgi:predicted SAM-dependent methyltransferase